MSVKQRMELCRILEKMNAHGSYGEKIGLEDASTFHGKQIQNKGKIREEK